jgi:lipopolysaccharide export system protein LptC
MTQRATAWFPVALLLVFAALTFWLDRELQPPEQAAGKVRHDPDYYVENFSVIRIGPDGNTQYSLNARRMEHYPDDDTTLLEAPKLVNFVNSSMTVTATSKKAMLSSDGDNIYLMDDVRLVRSAYADKDALTVDTSYLHIIPEKNLAQTDKPVQISDTHTLITSVGLEFNNETRILKLLSNVRSVYEKPNPTR